jgi:hypothetical protein
MKWIETLLSLSCLVLISCLSYHPISLSAALCIGETLCLLQPARGKATDADQVYKYKYNSKYKYTAAAIDTTVAVFTIFVRKQSHSTHLAPVTVARARGSHCLRALQRQQQ